MGRHTGYIEIRLPDTKADIEEVILHSALAAAAAQKHDMYALTGRPIQNREYDFDFTLPTARGDQYMDLLEAAPLEEYGGAYDKVPQTMRAGELAKKVYALIERKSSKYPGGQASPIHLLLYSTDWRLSLPPSVLTLLAHWLRRRPHVFRTVAYYLPAGINRSIWHPLLPSDNPELNDVDEERFEQVVAVRGDFSDVHQTSDGKIAFGYAQLDLTNFTHARMCSTGHMEFSRRTDS